jgi:hypothetical protein
MKQILDKVNEIAEVLNDTNGVTNVEWVKNNVNELHKVVKEICNLSVVSHSIFMIEQIWFDSMENDVSGAVGYSPFVFAESEEKAKEFCSKGEVYTNKRCWAVYGEMPQYKYKEIKYCG